LVADPANKTDQTDLAAIHRAVVNGFGLSEPITDEVFESLRLLARHRRDLVRKRSAVCCQIREHLEAVFPGYAACFDDFWKRAVALEVARRFASAEALRKTSLE
jgi:transposase